MTMEEYNRLIINYFLKKYDNKVRLLAQKLDIAIKDIETIARTEGKPAFIPVHVDCYTMRLPVVKAMTDSLSKLGYEVVLPSEFLRLAAKKGK